MSRGKKKSDSLTKRLFRDPGGQIHMFEKSLEEELEAKEQREVECLGMTFPNDQARREYFLTRLREGLEELHARLGGVPFTSVEDAVQRMQSIVKFPMGKRHRLYELAERMRDAHRREPDKDLLQLWKDQVGFPYGSIEDILNLSDPPYYTACPNPFIEDFIKQYGKPYDPKKDDYRREPFATDVSEGKNDPIYNAHSYHTKVPHKAIMRYILHYTEPGDVVFDGFAGTGMTGVAAQLCGDRKTVESLGYKVDEDGTIYQKEVDETGKEVWKPFSRLGARRAILNDLSPAATFIAYNYNTPVDVQEFEREAKRILQEVENECGWMYATLIDSGNAKEWAMRLRNCNDAEAIRSLMDANRQIFGRINYTVWSDVFVCPECTGEVVFWDVAVDKEAGKVYSEFPCPHCNAQLTKRTMERAWVTRYDKAIGQTIRQAKQVPVLINYSVGKKRYEKMPDAFDLALIEKIEQLDIPYWFPMHRMPEGGESRRNDDIGITHVHHFYTRRNLWVLASFLVQIGDSQSISHTGLFWHGSILPKLTKMNRYMPQHGSRALVGPMVNTLYIPPLAVENDVFGQMVFQMKKIIKALGIREDIFIATGGAQHSKLLGSSVDYIFTDPPFGANIMYSELNYIREAWLRVPTNNRPEAIENKVQGKSLPEYQRLMTECFKEYYSVLKPGRWMTVEFHNSKNSVWNSIQEALQTAGFVIADVRILDKTRGGLHSMISQTAVKQDLVISAYKPNGGLEDRFKLEAGTEEGVWDYIRTHLGKLAPPVIENGMMEMNPERMNYLIFDRMVAFHVQRGVTVPISAAEFYKGLNERFPMRDGMYFLPEQVAEYDKKRMRVQEVKQLELFVTDEASAIQWLKQQLTNKPQTFQKLHPQFLKEIGGWQRHEKPLELMELLEQNFLRYDGKDEVPSQIHSYLSTNYKELRNLPKDDPQLRAKAKDRWYVPDPNKAADLEKLREKALLREFEEYKQSKQRRLRVFRLEAVRAGFKKAWQERDYTTIIEVARKIPENVLQEDPKLLMWYDWAVTRMGEDI